MGKVLKKYRFKLRKSNKIIFVFKNYLKNKETKCKIDSSKQCWINLK